MISKNGLNLAFKWFDSCSGTSKWSNFAWPNKRESPRDSYISAHLLSIDLYSAEVWTIQILIKAFQWRRVNGMTGGCAAKWPNRRQSPLDSIYRHSAACHQVNSRYCWFMKADPYAPYIPIRFRVDNRAKVQAEVLLVNTSATALPVRQQQLYRVDLYIDRVNTDRTRSRLQPSSSAYQSFINRDKRCQQLWHPRWLASQSISIDCWLQEVSSTANLHLCQATINTSCLVVYTLIHFVHLYHFYLKSNQKKNIYIYQYGNQNYV